MDTLTHTEVFMEVMMKKIYKAMRKIIVLKTKNRRISQIVKYLTQHGVTIYSRDNSKYKGMSVFQLQDEMVRNGDKILKIRKILEEIKCGT